MTGDAMAPEETAAEERLNAMVHSEQHYFNSYNHHGMHHMALLLDLLHAWGNAFGDANKLAGIHEEMLVCTLPGLLLRRTAGTCRTLEFPCVGLCHLP